MAENDMYQKVAVFAVVRVDDARHVEAAITVKEILPTMEEAVKEVERLNRLNKAKGAYYIWPSHSLLSQGKNAD